MMTTKVLPEDTSTSSRLQIVDELFDIDYNFAIALKVGSGSSIDIDLTESVKRNKELMEGIEKAKRQVTEGDLLTYDEVF